MKQETLHGQPTIEKSGEIALFYNIAYNRLCQFIGKYEGNSKFDIRDMADKITNRGNYEFKDIIYKSVLKPPTYLAIYEKIMDERKGGGVMLDNHETLLVNETLLVFQKVRDYYSHFYHQDPKVSLPREFSQWLSAKAEEVKLKYANPNRKQKEFIVTKITGGQNNCLTAPKEDLNDPHYGQGVDFFLSFFLPRSFMSEYLNQRKGYKRTFNDAKDDTDYTYFRNICLHYSKRDSNRQNYLDEKGKITELTYKDYLNITKQSYLNSLPDFLLPYIKEQLIPQTVIKNPNNFLQMAVAFLSLDNEMPHRDKIQWEIVNKDLQNESFKESNKSGRKIVTPKYERKYTSNFENEYDQLTIQNKRVRMQLSELPGNKKADILIHEREIISLYFQKVYAPQDYRESIKKLVRVTTQYVSFLSDVLAGKLKEIREYGELKPYIDQEEIDWIESGDYKAKVPGLNTVFQWFFDKPDYNANEFKNKVVGKVRKVTRELESILSDHSSAEETNSYTYLKIPTQVYETPEKIKGLESKKRSEWTEKDIEAWKEWLAKRKKLKGIRHKKMQLALYAKDLILGKKAKFGSQNEKESFLAYAYLLDKPESKREGLIKNIVEKLREIDKNPNQETFNKKYLGLLQEAESFDNFVIGSLELAAERNKDILKNIEKGSEERILNLAKKYDVALKSVRKSKNQEIQKEFYNSRCKEILSAYIDNVNQPHIFLFQLPKRFFNPYEQEKQNLSGFLKENEKELYNQTLKKWQGQIKEEYHNFFGDFKEILEGRVEKNIAVAKKINYEIIKEILIEKSLAENFLKASNTGRWEFTRHESGATDYSTVVYPYKDFRITAPVKELRAFSSLFSNNRFDRMLDYLSAIEPTKMAYTLGEIKMAIFQHLWESRTFISRSLWLDKKYAEKYQNEIVKKTQTHTKYYEILSKQLCYFKIFDGSSKEILANLKIDREVWQKWSKYRNSAFHADILPPSLTYSVLNAEMDKALKSF